VAKAAKKSARKSARKTSAPKVAPKPVESGEKRTFDALGDHDGVIDSRALTTMATELDDEMGGGASEKIGAATKPGVSPNADTALESLSIGEIPRRGAAKAAGPSGSASSSASSPPLSGPVSGTPKRAGSRAELLDRIERLEREKEELRLKAEAVGTVNNEENIKELGGLIAMTLTIGSQFLAEKRGVHWLFDDKTESQPIGQAWAVALAPYSEQIAKYAPWAMALGVTWMVVKPKLDEDRRLLLEKAWRKKKSRRSLS
jgi:hypothetical protein